MFHLEDISSLTDFQRNAKKHLKEMKKTGRPRVLTVNGKAEVVIQDRKTYQKMLATIERMEVFDGIRKGLEQVSEGKAIPIEEFDAMMRKKYKFLRRT